MTQITQERLRQAVEFDGFIDTSILAAALKTDVYRELFDTYLKEAGDRFNALAAMSPDDATFDSVVKPYHGLDEYLGVLWAFLNTYHKNDGDDHTLKLMEHCQPLIVRFSDHVLLDEGFFHLLETIRAKEWEKLDESGKRSLDLLIRDRKIAGVHLPSDKKAVLRAINEKLTAIQETFGRNCTESRKIFFHQFLKEEDLGEMPRQDKDGAAQEAKKRGLEGWVFTLGAPSKLAVSRYVPDSSIRRLFMEAAMQVGTKAPHDNRPLVREILGLRREKAVLLGFKDYADYVLQTRMVSGADEVRSALGKLKGPYQAKGSRDIEELKTFAGGEVNMWDVSFHSNRLSKQKFSINESELQKYFELEATLAGLFAICHRLFGIEMKEAEVETYAPDVRTFEVRRGGACIGYFILDLFVRPTKRAGAWCEMLRSARDLPEGGRRLPIVGNVCNFQKATGDAPTCLSHYDAIVLFHEFGHALHALLSGHAYPNIGGFGVEWDFVELPSQLMENWCWHRDGLGLFAKHIDTGETIPDWLLEALKKKRTFMTGYEGVQQLEYASLDLELHTLPEVPADESDIDAYALAHERSWQVLSVPDFYSMYASFSHVFEGEYAAGYYSYTWAEMLEADVFERFEREGVLNAELGDAYRKHILEPGALKRGGELYRSFMGRDVDPSALLRKKGVS